MLVIVGARDNPRPAAEHLHQLVPHSQLHVVERHAHNEYYQAADEFNRAVGEFSRRPRVARGVQSSVEKLRGLALVDRDTGGILDRRGNIGLSLDSN
jgi:hypothetical protein